MISVYFSVCEKRDEHTAAHDLLAEKIRDHFGEGEFFEKAADGRPFLRHGGDISVSHSGGVVAVAVLHDGKKRTASADKPDMCFDCGASRIGIDIETLFDKTFERCEKIAGRFFFTEEKDVLGKVSGSEYVREFTRMWTQKEAVYKTGWVGAISMLSVNTCSLPKNAVLRSEVRMFSDKECTVTLCAIQ